MKRDTEIAFCCPHVFAPFAKKEGAASVMGRYCYHYYYIMVTILFLLLLLLSWLLLPGLSGDAKDEVRNPWFTNV